MNMPSTRATRLGHPGPRLAGAAAVLLLAVAGHAAWADGVVYKWVDAENRVHYSDRPPPDGQSAVSVTTAYAKAPSQQAARAAPSAAGAPPATPKPASTTTAASPGEKKVAQDLAVAHADDCAKAKETYDLYIRSRRLYKSGEGNERVYLSEAELDEARLNARRDMDSACGTTGQ